jgi:GT2 family glycosyltransferase
LARPTLSVIILNWNGRAYLEGCLNALASQEPPPDRVVLVDNDSTDGSAAYVRERYPWVVVRETGGNLGFAAGNNLALREEAADVIVLLNPDVILSTGAVAALAGALADDPTIGITGAKLWYPDGVTLQHAGGFITHPQALPGHFGIGQPDTGEHAVPREVAPREVAYVIGAAAAVRRDVLERVGLLDEGYFLYFEDADLCARAWRAGYRVVYCPAATGIHVESATTGKGSFAYLQRFHSGRWRYLLKHFPPGEIAGQTLPAEAAWLDGLGESERRAVSLAYLSTLRQLPTIWAARERDGAEPPATDEAATITAGLAALHDRARGAGADSAGLARLSAAAELRERPFASDTPLIGPLIARFRTAWNNVASRWYLGHLMTQQSRFNQLAVNEMERYEIELREQMALLEEQIVVTAELQDEVERLKARLAGMRREAAARPGG